MFYLIADLDNAPTPAMGPGPRVKVFSSGKVLGKVVKPAKPKKVKTSMKPQVSPTIGSLGYSNPLGAIHNGAFRVKVSNLHYFYSKNSRCFMRGDED